jgi:predicted metal-binding membrane protein
MSETPLSGRHGLDPAVPVVAMLGSLAAAAWAILAAGAMGHASHDVMLGSGHLPRVDTVVAFLSTWQIMVVAMMLPLAIPAAVAQARRTHRWWRATSAVVATTCVVWTGFAVTVLAADAVLHRLVAAWPWLASREWLVTSAVLALAGTIQMLPFQQRALGAARRASASPWRYAVICLGSCGPLMLVMFAVGAESLVWMVVLAMVMTAERVAGHGARLAPSVGLALISIAVLAPFPAGELL